MDYQQIVELSQIAALILFLGLFIVVLVYALRPKAKETFERYAAIPLKDDDASDGGA